MRLRDHLNVDANLIAWIVVIASITLGMQFAQAEPPNDVADLRPVLQLILERSQAPAIAAAPGLDVPLQGQPAVGRLVRRDRKFDGADRIGLGQKIMNDFIQEVSDLAAVDKPAIMEGRTLSLVLNPKKTK